LLTPVPLITQIASIASKSQSEIAASLHMKRQTDQLLQTRWTLIERLKNWDDRESWREFFNIYWKLIYGVAVKSGLTHAEAQDVVQETIVSVSKSMEKFKADPSAGSFKSWLLNLTRWRITDQMRKRGREVQGISSNPQTDSNTTTPEERLADPATGALDRIWEEEWERHVLEAALEKVKEQAGAGHYQIFYLHAIKQVPPAKVAQTLGVNVDQVYLIKHRLSKVLERAIKEVEAYTG
jgi:RNA polymerase sigma factor (sigma-70 family)